MFSNRYIFIYSSVMVILVAVTLTVVAIQLKPFQEKNIRVEKMRNILTSVNIESTAENAIPLYEKYIKKSFVVNQSGQEIQGEKAFEIDLANELKKSPEKRNLPVFVAVLDNADTAYIFPLRGKGLWGPIWGYIALKPDMNTVVGVMFDHKSETPGLGAEINTNWFQAMFHNKTIFNENGEFVSIKTIKGKARPDDPHGVDAISGGTITSNGLTHMLHDCLENYVEFFKHHKKS